MKVWHICSYTSNMCNGMAQVIPEHVNNQSNFEKVILLNLDKYKPVVWDSVSAYDADDFSRYGFKGLVEKNGKPDVFVIHGIYLVEIWKFWRKYVYKKTPYVIIPHASLTYQIQNKNKLKKMIGNIIAVNKMVKHADLLQFLSKGEKETSTCMDNKNIVIAPNGIYLNKVQEKKKNIDKTVILYIGRYDLYHKGLDMLLEAINNNKQYLRDNCVIINMYGRKKMSDYNYICDYIKKNQLQDIIYTYDAIFGSEKERAYIESDYFILPSRFEGLPMGYLEACSYGVPVLITEQTNVGEDVKTYNNGCVVEATTKEIGALLRFSVESNNKYNEMSVASLKCATNYEWSNVAKNTLVIYSSIVKEQL